MATRTIMAVAAVLGFALTTHAGVKTFSPSGGGGVWNTSGNWSPAGVPTGADRVVIPTGKTCTLDVNATADTLDVDGVLQIAAGFSLTLENNSDNVAGTPDNSVVDGEVLLLGGATVDSVLSITTASHTFSGSGKIQGVDSFFGDNHIEIGVNLTLVNQLATSGKGIRGSMTITGLTASGQTNGTLANEGLVQAADEDDARIELASTTILSDTDTAVWSVYACKGELAFYRAAVVLSGDLYTGSNSGVFEFNASVATCGTYTRNGGGLAFSNSAVLVYAVFATGPQTCGGDPGTLINTSYGCGVDEYIVSTNQAACIFC